MLKASVNKAIFDIKNVPITFQQALSSVCIVLVLLRSCLDIHYRDLFRTQSNIYDQVFLQKQLTVFSL